MSWWRAFHVLLYNKLSCPKESSAIQPVLNAERIQIYSACHLWLCSSASVNSLVHIVITVGTGILTIVKVWLYVVCLLFEYTENTHVQYTGTGTPHLHDHYPVCHCGNPTSSNSSSSYSSSPSASSSSAFFFSPSSSSELTSSSFFSSV